MDFDRWFNPNQISASGVDSIVGVISHKFYELLCPFYIPGFERILDKLRNNQAKDYNELRLKRLFLIQICLEVLEQAYIKNGNGKDVNTFLKTEYDRLIAEKKEKTDK